MAELTKEQTEPESFQDKTTEKAKKDEKKASDSPKKKNRDNESAVKAGKVTGAGKTSVKQQKKLRAEHPDLADKVKSGELSLNKAMSIAKERQKAKELAQEIATPPPAPEPEVKTEAEPPKTESEKTKQKSDEQPEPEPKTEPDTRLFPFVLITDSL